MAIWNTLLNRIRDRILNSLEQFGRKENISTQTLYYRGDDKSRFPCMNTMNAIISISILI